MTKTADRPPYGAALLVTAVVMTIYVLTIGPTTQFWDTPEYIAAAKVLGIPHPPGSPLFVVLGNVWGRLFFFIQDYGLRINLFAAATSAVASGFLFLVAERWLQPVVASPRPRLIAAFAGILVGATAFTVWNQSVVNEKVYTVSMLAIALILWLIVRWHDLEAGDHRDGILILIAYLLALTSTNHMMSVLVASAVGVYVIVTDWQLATRPWVVLLGLLTALAVFGSWGAVINGPDSQRFLVLAALGGALGYVAWKDPAEFRQPALYIAVLAVVVGISLNYTFLPIRAAQFPPINEGEPTNWHALWSVLSREQYQKPPLTHRMADFPSQIANYVQYYAWQYGRDWPGARRVLAGCFAALGLGGALVQWRRDKRAAAAMTALMVTVTLLLIYYMNFRYGFSIRPAADLDREVRERDYFFVASFQLWGLWVALALGWAWTRLQQAARPRLGELNAWIISAPVLLVALVPLAGNRLTASRAHETLARDFAYDLLQSVEPYGILITAGDNDLFPLWYAQEVDGVRRDVTVLNQSLMRTDWHVRQILRRQTPAFEPDEAAAPWRDQRPTAPTAPVLRLDESQVDSIPPYFEIPRRSSVRLGSVTAILEPGFYYADTFLSLQIIRDNIGKRPIYFARTTGPTVLTLGLQPHITTEGMVFRLHPDSVTQADGLVDIPGYGWFDLARTEELLFDVYHGEVAARERPRGWIDPPSQNILGLYTSTYTMYAQVVLQMGDPTDTARVARANQALELATRMRASLQIPPGNEQPRVP